MHIKSLAVRNFRAIDFAEITRLPEAVVIAGPNGCGKSCLLDAIRIWKSAYGGYNDNEFEQGFSEFGVSSSRLDDELPSLFRDRTQSVVIEASIELSKREREFIERHADDLVARRRQREVRAGARGPGSRRASAAIQTLQPDQSTNADEHRKEVDSVRHALKAESFTGTFRITPRLELQKSANVVLELIYSMFLPESIGIFEYHSAQRYYQQREDITNVSLRVDAATEQYGQQAIFNWAAKYQNVKTQLASSYVRELLAREAGEPVPVGESLGASLAELFRLFFPDKEFLGPQPTKDGRLTLNVRTATGHEHDITDLSSGEKEVLYGYLRLRNLAPRDSVLLLDEPELHLNPRLVSGLPRFYRAHLGQAFSNQIWLVTHSDVLLEQAIGLPDFAVYHMVPAQPSAQGSNQLLRVTDASLDRAIMDLVGEKAGYRPDAKLVIFEGGGDSEFDRTLTCDLFPEFSSQINPISGTFRSRVIELRRLIEKAAADGRLKFKVYSITDRDSMSSDSPVPQREFSWDVYHIENYLLESAYILSALREALRERCRLADVYAVDRALEESAKASKDALIARKLKDWVSRTIWSCIQVGNDPSGQRLAAQLHSSASGSAHRLMQVVHEQLTEVRILEEKHNIDVQLQSDLDAGTWRRTWPGRDILRRFVSAHGDGIAYEVLRNLIIARMRADGYRPAGMRKVIEAVLAD